MIDLNLLYEFWQLDVVEVKLQQTLESIKMYLIVIKRITLCFSEICLGDHLVSALIVFCFAHVDTFGGLLWTFCCTAENEEFIQNC